MAKIRLSPGAWTSAASFLVTGAAVLVTGTGAVTGATASQFPLQVIGLIGMVIGLSVLIWGLTIDGERWWMRLRGKSRDDWVPFYKAIQWIARDSVWAASYAEKDDEWPERAQRLLVSALSMGQIGSTGIKKVVGYTDAGLTEIPKEEWQRAGLITKNLSFEIPVAEMRLPRYTEQDPGMYVDPRVDRNAMRRLWPRRSLLARWRRNSPVERLDLGSLFEKQDQWYPYALKRHGVK